MSARREFPKTDPPHTEEDKLRIQQVEYAYFNEGRKLFDCNILEKISEILAGYRADKYTRGQPPILEIPDFVDGDKSAYTINLNLELHGDELNFLQYFPIQKLINPYWYRSLTGFADPPNPIKNDSSLPFDRERKGEPSKEEVDEYETMRTGSHEIWKTNGARESVLKTFREKEVKQQLKKITKIIAFGNGSSWHVFRCNKEHKDITRYIAQHAVIEEMRAYIEGNFMPGPKVRLYAQDNHYTKKDEEMILNHFGIQRLEDPAGTLEIDDGTLVSAMKPDFPLLQLIADMSLAKPPIIFHDEIKRNESWQEYKDAVLLPSGRSCPKEGIEPNPTSPRVEELIQNYKEYTINDPDGLLRGNKTRLYVLKESQEQGQAPTQDR